RLELLLQDLDDALTAADLRCLGGTDAGGCGRRPAAAQPGGGRTGDARIVDGNDGTVHVEQGAARDDLVEPLAIAAGVEQGLGRRVQAAQGRVEHRELDLDLGDDRVEVGDDAVDVGLIVGEQ